MGEGPRPSEGAGGEKHKSVVPICHDRLRFIQTKNADLAYQACARDLLRARPGEFRLQGSARRPTNFRSLQAFL